jgi:two-component system OmpR family sensor kinase
MSSSRPTEVTARHPARWRSPAGWPLRSRIVAIMLILLTVLGIAVGITAEIALHKTLYDQVDAKLDRSAGSFHGPPGLGPGGTDVGGRPFRGAEPGSISLTVTEAAGITGGLVESYTDVNGNPDTRFAPLTDADKAKLAAVRTDGTKTDVSIDKYGSFRVVAVAVTDYDGDTAIRITGVSLKSTKDTLLRIAVVIAGSVLIALIIAGWAGAAIVRRTMRPLGRVAATATRVAQLRLDRGEVQLAQRVPDPDTDPRTEVGQVGAALNQLLDHVGNALEARHASEMQVRQFVADASHELRTPLAAIRGYAELSRRSRQPMPDETAHVLNRVESEAKRMTLLVEDLLLLARLDAGRPLAHDPVDLTMLVVDAVSDAHATGPGHTWQLDLPEEPVTVIGDGARLHQVLANLLANARTHTPEGTTVTVGVSATPDAAVLRVVDGGPGIPAELQPHIFERFARGDSSRSRAAGSTGLGLSIVHAVVTAHGGEVSVHSVPGRTEFTVLLPPAAPDPAVPPAEQFARLAPRPR